MLCLWSVGWGASLLFGVESSEREVAPLFTGDKIPTPPAQNSSWAAERSPRSPLEAALFLSGRRLFQQGLADPRGCEYRSIKIGVGSCWDHEVTLVETQGWVLPDSEPSGQRFAVAWNGLVYPVVEVGLPADLALDLAQLLHAREHPPLSHHPFSPTEFPAMNGDNESNTVLHFTPHELKACLLLRLGYTDEAVSLVFKHEMESSELYGVLAEQLTWNHYNRAICAHMRGDFVLAIASTRLLLEHEAIIRAQNAAQSKKVPLPLSPPFLSHLTQTEALHADLERRLSAPGSPSADPITQLIAELENLKVEQPGQPNWILFVDHPVVQKLIEAGNEAVEPLLDCMEHDKRLTQSVQFHRDFHTRRTVLGVNEVAYEALLHILTATFEGPISALSTPGLQDDAKRARVVGQIREFWNHYQGLDAVERWYAILADDEASQYWAENALNIVRATHHKPIRSPRYEIGAVIATGSKEKDVLAGEALRVKTDPTVTELMILRMRAFPNHPAGSAQARLIEQALRRWEPNAAVD